MIVKGQKINDRYEIIRVLGEGGMANVYLANDTILDRKVAVKVLRGDLANDERFVRRFQREALSASSLNHPNIVEIYDVGEDDGNFYIVMEYIEGKNLKQLIKRRTKLTLPEVIDIMKQLSDGISHAHDSYIIHRDIKPQNMLILESGLVKITDFGIAVALNSTQLTQTNSVMGSVHYLPPEQAAGKGATFKSDIYSLGILMYELLTGSLPFKGENAVEIALKQIKEPIPSVRKFDSDIPQSVENIVLKACAKNPKNRYESVRDMYEDLCTCLDEEHKHDDIVVYEYPEFEGSAKKEKEEIERDIKQVEKNNEPEEKESHNKFGWIIGSIIAVIVIGLCIFLLLLPKLTTKPDVKIPDVSSKTIVEAEKELKDAGFEVNLTIEEVYSAKVDKDLVVKTSPQANRSVKKGTMITIYVSKGTEKIVLEDYTNMNASEVKGKLEAMGLVVTIEKTSVEDISKYKDKENEVIEQDPVKDTELEPGNQVILYVANINVYPDFTDGSYAISDVEDFATKYDINLYKVAVETDEYPPGTIISQSRKSGIVIVNGTDLTIRYAEPVTSEVLEEESTE